MFVKKCKIVYSFTRMHKLSSKKSHKMALFKNHLSHLRMHRLHTTFSKKPPDHSPQIYGNRPEVILTQCRPQDVV